MDLIEDTLKAMEELEKANENSVPAAHPTLKKEEPVVSKRLTSKKNIVK
jgi:hypothetical protein